MSFVRSHILLLSVTAAYMLLSQSVFANVPSKDRPDTLSEWVQQTKETVRAAIVYPQAARELSYEGVAEMRITIDQQGRLINSAVARSSGHTELDSAADILLQHIHFPALPDGFSGNMLTFNIAVNYDLLSLND